VTSNTQDRDCSSHTSRGNPCLISFPSGFSPRDFNLVLRKLAEMESHARSGWGAGLVIVHRARGFGS
jgi:hypothetical protein